MTTIRFTGAESFDRLAARIEGADARLLARSTNAVMNKERTAVRRALAKETGAPYSRVGRVTRTRPATPGSLSYAIVAEDQHTSLKDFKSRQTRRGVSAAPWGDRKVFPHSFIIGKFGGHTFVRIGSASAQTREKLEEHGIKGVGRFPIRRLWGPNIPREMVREDSSPLETWGLGVARLQERILVEAMRQIGAGI